MAKKHSDKLRDQERPTVLGYELDRETLTPKRTHINTAPGDWGATPIWSGGEIGVGEFTGTFRMTPSGDIVSSEEKERRLRNR